MEKETLLTPVWEVVTTLPNEESASAIAKQLIDARLAACVQIAGPIRSLYRWQDAVHDDAEWKLTIKTDVHRLDACWEELQRLHPYQVPELAARPFIRVSLPYRQWVSDQVASADSLGPPWHLRIAGFPSDAHSDGSTIIRGKTCEKLQLPTGPSPMVPTFEQAAAELASLPRLHVEMDGSFVWNSSERVLGQPTWRLDGMLYDRENRLQYVELKGSCDRPAWERLVKILAGTSSAPPALIIQWIEQGTWVRESEFKKCVD